MKKILTFLILAAIPLTVCGQFNPPPTGAFTYSGSSWVAAGTSATGGALGFTPPPAALYCYNSTSGQWVPFDASCQVGGAGVYLPLSGGTMTGPVSITNSSGEVGGCPMVVSSTNLCVTAAPYNASGYIVTDATTSPVTSGTTLVPVSNGSNFSIGQTVWIATAGTSASNYSGAITGISGNNLTVSPATGSTVPSGIPVWTLGSTTTSATVTSGSSIIPVGVTVGYKVGHGVLIAGAGAAGADAVLTITSVSANSLSVTPVTSTTVSGGTVVQHDDSAAIQAAINALPRGGTVYLPRGYFQLNGPFQNPTGENAILALPEIPYFSGTPYSDSWLPMISLTIKGDNPAETSEGYLGNSSVISLSGTILATNKSSGNLIAGYEAAGLGFTNIHLTVTDLTLRGPDNPGITMLNAHLVSAADFERLNCDTFVAALPSQPTNANGRCIVFPGVLNSGFVRGVLLNSIGYYTAYTIYEHTTLNNIQAFANWQALDMVGGGYGDYISSFGSQGNTYGLVVDPASTSSPIVNISRFQIEDQSSAPWMTSVADVYDPNNILQGSIQIDSFIASPNIVGGAYVAVSNMNGNIFTGVTNSAFGLIGTGVLYNYLTYASTFTNAVWAKNNGVTITAGATSAPDWTITASKMVEGTAPSVAYDMFQSMVLGAAQVTCSAYVKPAERSYIQFRFDQGAGPGTIFNLSGNGSIVSTQSGYASTIRGYNGWYRITTTTTTTAGTWYEDLRLCSDSLCGEYTGDGTSGLYVWGAQCSQGSSPGPLVNTTSTAITGRIGFTAPNIAW